MFHHGINKERVFTFKDLMNIERVSSPSIHPSGRYIAFVTSRHDHKENKVSSTIRLFETETGEMRDLTPGKHKDTSPS